MYSKTWSGKREPFSFSRVEKRNIICAFIGHLVWDNTSVAGVEFYELGGAVNDKKVFILG